MFKIVVLSCLVAYATAKPGLIHGVSAPVAVAAPAVAVAAPPVVVPTAVSQQSRHDIISPGLITYTTAHIAPVLAAAPVVATAPVLAAAPVRISSAATSRFDVRQPVAAGIAAAPVSVGGVGYGNALGGGLTFGGIGVGGGTGFGGHGYGK